jgi:hypothetical protein
MQCAKCHLPIDSLEDLIQVPLGIVNPALMGTVCSGEPVAYHTACSDWVEKEAYA